MKFTELKQHIKDLAKEIKEKKALRKGAQNGYVSGLDRLRYEARHHHIAYCLLRGRTMEQIESKTREDNKPSTSYIEEIKSKIEPREEELHEDVCCGA